ncbi:MAG: YcxB family protein [Cytophagales bacterium]|nr:YcxB family protein [Cytophagales bacterium]
MLVKTKKYKLANNTYIKLGMKNIIREQWWVFLIALAIASGTLFIHTYWFIMGAAIGLFLYFLFWLIQFYGITQLEENRIIFEKLSYEITSHQVLVQLSAKQGMPIPWSQIKRASQGKDYFLLVVSKGQLIHLPHKIFNSKHEIKFVETILKRKGFIK